MERMPSGPNSPNAELQRLDEDVHRPPALCAAIVARLTFGSNIIETETDSYRLAQTRAQQGTVS